MPSYPIYPSLLSANVLNLEKAVEAVMAAGVDTLHLDIMDNHYVPNLSFSPLLCEQLHARFPALLLDVHLMASPVDALIQSFAKAGASRISIHPNATQHLDRSLQSIQQAGCLAGLALNPATSLDCLVHCMHRLDFVLIMTVNPGFGGQAFIPSVLPKIETLHAQYPTLPICVDGSVSTDTIQALAKAGATQFVAGSAVFNQKHTVHDALFCLKQCLYYDDVLRNHHP